MMLLPFYDSQFITLFEYGNGYVRRHISVDVRASDSFENKNPDLRIDGLLWEVERSSNSLKINNLKHAVDEGSQQADYVIVDLSQDVEFLFMLRVAKGRFKDHINLKIIEFRYKGKYTAFFA